MNAEILAAIKRTELTLRCADLRDEVRRDAPAALASFGIDRPDLRWAASRAFIRAARAEAEARFDLALRRIVLLDRIAATWKRRGAPGFGPDESDVADARLAYQRQFREQAPSLAHVAPRTYGRTSDNELMRLARDQERYEAARDARNVAGAA